jgi:hypothetical protein
MTRKDLIEAIIQELMVIPIPLPSKKYVGGFRDSLSGKETFVRKQDRHGNVSGFRTKLGAKMYTSRKLKVKAQGVRVTGHKARVGPRLYSRDRIAPDAALVIRLKNKKK